MAVNLLALSAKKVADVSTFMKENASVNKLKYATEANVTHRVFFPIQWTALEDGEEIDEKLVVVKDDVRGKYVPYVLALNVHSWGEGTSYDSCICTKGIKVEGTEYDGTCPVCARLTDASDIVKYVKAEKEAECTLVGEARKKFIEELDKKMWQDRKVSSAATKYYVAVVKLNCDKDGKAIVDGATAKFSIHIAAWTKNTMQKFLDALTMQDDEPNIGGREFKIKYGDYNEVMTRVGQAQASVVDVAKALVQNGNPLHKEITEAMGQFDFERSIELCRTEVQTKSQSDIRISMNSLFREWDNYKAALAVNPDAKYLEYSTAGTPTTTTGSTESPTAPTNAIATGAQAGTTGGSVGVDELDAALGL